MTTREKTLVMIALIALGWGLGYYFWYVPTGQTLKNLDKDLETYAAILTVKPGQEIDALLAFYRVRQTEQAERVLGPCAIASLLAQLNTGVEKSGVRLTRFSLEKAKNTPETWPLQTYKLTVTGTFTQVRGLMQALETSKYLLTLEEVRIFKGPAYAEKESADLSLAPEARCEANQVQAEIYFSLAGQNR